MHEPQHERLTSFMKILGHRNIQSTLIYAQFIDFRGDDYVSKAAKNAEEVQQLVEAAFEYVFTTPEEVVIFRKRKCPPKTIF